MPRETEEREAYLELALAKAEALEAERAEEREAYLELALAKAEALEADRRAADELLEAERAEDQLADLGGGQ